MLKPFLPVGALALGSAAFIQINIALLPFVGFIFIPPNHIEDEDFVKGCGEILEVTRGLEAHVSPYGNLIGILTRNPLAMTTLAERLQVRPHLSGWSHDLLNPQLLQPRRPLKPPQ